MPLLADLLDSLVQRPWTLTRTLRNGGPQSPPSGWCSGIATFSLLRESSQKMNKISGGETRIREVLYHEKGEFEMRTGPVDGSHIMKAPFEKKYIWRLEEEDARNSDKGEEKLSIHFVKPAGSSSSSGGSESGSEKGKAVSPCEEIDYLFHELSFQQASQSLPEAKDSARILRANGDHLCVQDDYQSEYTFKVDNAEDSGLEVRSWEMSHTVKGPQKNQLIHTVFNRSS
ncbi:MAG: hypothetical protein Q9227_002131 [Pyrenula ochraceoflavens]